MASWLEKLRDFFSDDLYQPEQQKLVEKNKKQKTKKRKLKYILLMI